MNGDSVRIPHTRSAAAWICVPSSSINMPIVALLHLTPANIGNGAESGLEKRDKTKSERASPPDSSRHRDKLRSLAGITFIFNRENNQRTEDLRIDACILYSSSLNKMMQQFDC